METRLKGSYPQVSEVFKEVAERFSSEANYEDNQVELNERY